MKRMFGLSAYIKRCVAAVLSLTVLMAVLPFVCVQAEYGYDLPWLWPVPGSYKINCLDYYYDGGIHSGGQCMDIGANGYTGTERLDVISATSGTVLYIQKSYDEANNRGSGWGNYVIVRSGNINIVYGHLQSVSCTYGTIEAGDVIGKMGNTGNSTGVHLHLQAYPYSGNANSTEIPVFEQYRTNPLYYEEFQFMKGLETTSVRYGAWISEYYKTLTSSYYSYSGGLSMGLPVTEVSAVVSVINTSGADVRSLPLSSNSYITDTIENGQKARITGYYTDAYGDIWLALEENENGGGWLRATDVGFYDYDFSLSADSAVYPSGEHGAFCDLTFGGTIESRNTITSYTAKILSRDTVIASYTCEVDAAVASLEGISKGLGIDELDDGEYRFVLSAVETASYPGADPVTKETVLITSDFTINSELSDKIPPILEAIQVTELTQERIAVSCIASDNKGLNRVTVSVQRTDGTEATVYVCTENQGSYDCVIPVSDLGGASGEYKLMATAYDTYGNTDSKERTVTVPAASDGEVWKANTAVKIRDGAGLSYTHVGGITKGSSFTVTEAVIADGYVWGHHADGWSPLYEIDGEELCSYVSGYLYSVSFDLNGGTGETPVSINKRYGVDITLPSVVPEKEGYTFLGWSPDSGAKAAVYLPSASYSANASVTLFAVFSDTTAPTVVSVSRSETEWTNQAVTLTVYASDASGTVYYSFDGGSIWQASNIFAVEENTVFAAKQIAVRDTSGNIAYYPNEIKIENIDCTAPSVSEATAALSVSGTSVVFTFKGITDELSGVSSYELIYASDENFTDETILTIENGTAVTLTEGVYYWKLAVYDAAGNRAEREFDRFRIGSPERLAVPEGIRVVSTGSDVTELAWNAVSHADRYAVSISLAEAFTDAQTFYTDSCGIRLEELAAGETYYFRVAAMTEDGVYLTSPWSETGSFLTQSSDSTVHGFVSLSDAVIDHETRTVSYTASYAASTLDITAYAESKATVTYWTDSALTVPVSAVNALPFTSETAIVYLCVTAENGEESVYTLTITRAAASAQTPAVEFLAKDEELLVGDSASELAISASVTDGGTLSVVWYCVYNGASSVRIGEGNTLLPDCGIAGTYAIYAVVTNRNDKCASPVATFTTETVTVTVSKRTSSLSVVCGDYTYNGQIPGVAAAGYLGDGVLTYRFFTDSSCQNEISAPVDAGIYYVVAYASETDAYHAVVSEAKQFEIFKAVPSEELALEVIQPTLRDRNGYVTVSSTGVEYRISGSDAWIDAGTGRLVFPENTDLEFRFAETANFYAGSIVTVEIGAFDGTDDIVPDGASGMFTEDGCLFIDGSANIAQDILDGLEKSENVRIYSADGSLLNGTDTLVGTGAVIAVEDSLGTYLSLPIIVLGDMNGDGLVSREDALLIMRISNGMTVSEGKYDLAAGDLDRDGKLTSADAYLAYARA